MSEMQHKYFLIYKQTRTKTSIRNAKENDRELEEREKERQKERYREGGRDKREREREVKGIERVKGAQSKILIKSPIPRSKAQRNVDYKNNAR